MPSYELVYFNFKGRAEVARCLFALADVEYKDTRVDGEEFKKMKPDLVFGVVPELRVDGDFRLCQSGTINRYLAEEFGLMGNTKKERFYVDMIVGCFDDILEPLVAIFFEQNESWKADLTAKYKEKLPNYLVMLETILSKNDDGSSWFVGNSPTLADVYVANGLSMLQGDLAEFVEKCPKLVAHGQRFKDIPKIADWIKKRPVTDH